MIIYLIVYNEYIYYFLNSHFVNYIINRNIHVYVYINARNH